MTIDWHKERILLADLPPESRERLKQELTAMLRELEPRPS
jgi:hypothetical protein